MPLIQILFKGTVQVSRPLILLKKKIQMFQKIKYKIIKQTGMHFFMIHI
jgi:hypothetical protein